MSLAAVRLTVEVIQGERVEIIELERQHTCREQAQLERRRDGEEPEGGRQPGYAAP